MADRRTDDTPLAPRRPLGASGGTSRGGERVAARSETRSDTGTGTGQRRSPDRDSAGSSSGDATRSSETTAVPAGQKGRTPATGTSRTGAPGRPRTRRARLRLTHLDPWSVMKTSFLLSVAFGIVTVIAVAVVWSVLGAAGVWSSINQTVAEVIGGDTGAAFDVEDYIGASRVMGFTMIVAVVDVILITAIATLGAFLYNLAAALLGGLEVTLAEDER